jgi:ABC-type oligopeptide transport system substrate-binding subunit
VPDGVYILGAGFGAKATTERNWNMPGRIGMKQLLRTLAIVAGVITAALPGAHAEPVHAIAMHGEPALPAGFTHLPYVNPDAPKGGKVTYGVVGTFDSVRPFIVKSMRTTARGLADPVFGNLVYETLMARSQDEPFTLYGLLRRRSSGTTSAVSFSTTSIRPHAGLMASRSPPTM